MEADVTDPDEPRKPPQNGVNLPLWFRVTIIGLLALTLIVHIFVDAFLKDYEGAGTSLMLGGIVGTALGVNEFLRTRGGGG